jgi:hypothetical protein
MLTDVIDLLNHHGAKLVTGIGDTPQVWDHRIISGAQVTSGEYARFVRRDGLANNHRSAAASTLCVVSQMALARETILCHVGGMRAEVQSVLERLVPQA